MPNHWWLLHKVALVLYVNISVCLGIKELRKILWPGNLPIALFSILRKHTDSRITWPTVNCRVSVKRYLSLVPSGSLCKHYNLVTKSLGKVGILWKYQKYSFSTIQYLFHSKTKVLGMVEKSSSSMCTKILIWWKTKIPTQNWPLFDVLRFFTAKP